MNDIGRALLGDHEAAKRLTERKEAIKHITTWMYATSDLLPKQVAQALDMALSALRGPTREMVERMRGEWSEHYKSGVHAGNGVVCTKCDMWNSRRSQFCPACGRPMMDKAVDMMLERWKEALDEST